MIIKYRTAIAVIAICVAAQQSNAQQAALPEATGQQQVYYPNLYFATDIKYSNMPNSPVFLNNINGQASAFSDTATSSVATSASGNFGAYASLGYQVEISGPANMTVPIIISGRASTSGNFTIFETASNYGYGGEGAKASLSIFSPTLNVPLSANSFGAAGQENISTSLILVQTESGYRGDGPPSQTNIAPTTLINRPAFEFSLLATVMSNSPIIVSMQAVSQAVNLDEFANASVDPFFEIDPTFALAREFSVITSPGVGNVPVSAIPEPSTWAMMLLGFVGLSFMGYRRQSNKDTTARAAA